MTHTAVLVIQYGQTALDMARERQNHYAGDEGDETKYDELVKYLEEIGK